MRQLAFVTAVLLALPARADERAAAVGKEVWQALGGDAAWNQARYLRFDFVVERGGKALLTRAHYWDRFSGRYRVDGSDGKSAWRVYMNLNDKTGVAFVDGKKVSDAAKSARWIKDGYEAFINDSYWLLAPYKLFDPGVNLAYAGKDKGPHGERCDVLKLTFGPVGLTPKDIYWQLVDEKSHLVVAWRYVLDGKKAAPTTFAWSDWRKVGPIMLATLRESPKEPETIRFANLAVSDKPDEAALTPP
jgi:hypothetical protein